MRRGPVTVASIFLLFSTLTLRAGFAQSSDLQAGSATHKRVLKPVAVPFQPQEQFAPYWTSEPGWHTELQLRNNMAQQTLTVTPALRSSDGQEVKLAPVTLEPNEVRNLDLHALLASSAPQFVGQYGSVVFRYTSPFMRNLYAVAMVHDDGYPVAFHLDAVSQAQDWKRGGREGIWWLPNGSAAGYAVLTNQSDKLLAAVLSISDAVGRASSQVVRLAPRSTQRFSVRDLLARAGFSGTFGGLTVSTDGAAGSLDTTSFVYDEIAGFGAILKMFDRDPLTKLEERDFAKTGKWTTRAPMLALSAPDPFLAFPAGTVLQPQLLVRNTTSKPLKASLRFNWRTGTATGKIAIPELILAPNETRRIDVQALQDAGTISAAANWASVIVTSAGDPDDLVIVASSYDKTLRYGAQTPFSDQLSVHMEGGEWQVDATHNSLIAAGNGSTAPIKADFTVFYNQGHERYTLERALGPEEQMWIDMAQLIRNRVPDKDGKMLPADLTSGTYQLMEVNAIEHASLGSLYEGKVIIDKTFGHAAYGCMICCGVDRGTFSPDPWSGAVGFTSPGNVVTYDACSGIGPESANGYYSTWGTLNTAIATSSSHLITGVGPGSTGNFAQGRIPSGAGQAGRTCPTALDHPSSTANVQPTITGPNTVWWFNGEIPTNYATQIILQSSGGTGTIWGVTQGADKVAINATGSTLAVSSSGTNFSSAVGDIVITAQANLQTSAPFHITTRTPKTFTDQNYAHNCDAQFGYDDFYNYFIRDQLSDYLPMAVEFGDRRRYSQ